MFEPELNPQRLVKFSVRAYYTNIGTLSQSPFSNNTANLRTLALAAGGLTYNFQNERNNRGFATIECEGRFGTTFYRDYVVSTGSTFAPATPYEQLVITGAGSQTVEFSTVRPGIGCGCNTGGSSCTFNCNSGAQNTFITIRDTSCGAGFSRFVFNSTGAPTVNFKINNDRNYVTNGSSVTLAANVATTVNLQPGQFRHYTFTYTAAQISTLSNLQFTLTGIDAATQTCFSQSTVGTTFPGTAASSYCPQCSPFNNAFIYRPCCGSGATFTITVYAPAGGAAVSGSILPVLSVLANPTVVNIPVGTSKQLVTTPPAFAGRYQFATVTIPALTADQVLNVAIAALNGGTRTIYGRFLGLAGNSADSSCLDFTTQLTCAQSTNVSSGSLDCNSQFRACDFPAGTYNLGILSAANSTGTSISFWVSTVTTMTAGSGNVLFQATGSVPLSFPAPSLQYQHFKFTYPGPPNRFGYQFLNPRIQINLRQGVSAHPNNSLALAISSTPLAGSTNFPNTGASCGYSNDPAWSCSAIAGNNINCTVSLCPTSFLFPCTAAGNTYYISVTSTATTPTVAAPFTLQVRYLQNTQPTNVAQINVVPASTNVDDAFSSICNPTNGSTAITLSGGCVVRPTGNTVNRLYFNVPFAPLSLGPNDYVTVNFTNPNQQLSVFVFSSSTCEPASPTAATCTAAAPCFFASDPCNTRSNEIASNGGGQEVDFHPVGTGFTYVVTSSGPMNQLNFSVEFRIVRPLQVIVPLTAASPNFTQTYVMWNWRYAFFNIQTPNMRNAQLFIQVTGDCFATGQEPAVYFTKDNYIQASQTCSEVSGTIPFSTTVSGCQLTGGNNYLTVRSQLNSVQFAGVSTSEGRISPQVRFTVTARLTFNNPIPVPWGCCRSYTQPAAFGSSNTYVFLAQDENFGTQVQFSFNNFPTTASIKVISPLYRQSTTATAGWIERSGAEYNTEWFPIVNNVQSCYAATQTGDIGVYELTGNGVITIPACDFRNGRYFVQILNNFNLSTATGTCGAAATAPSICTTIDRKDYPVLTISQATNYIAESWGELTGQGLYQFYRIDVSKDNFRIDVSISSPGNPNLNAVSAYLTRGNFGSTSAVGISTTPSGCTAPGYNCYSCGALTCTSANIATTPCVISDVCINTEVYYLGITSTVATSCLTVPYDIRVTGNRLSITRVTAGATICGNVLNSANYYQLDLGTTNLAYAQLEIMVKVLRSDTATNVGLSFSNARAQTGCANCNAFTSTTSDTATISLSCGLTSTVFFGVYSNSSVSSYYWVMSKLTTYAPVAIPAGTNVRTAITTNTLFTLDNTGSNRVALLASSIGGNTLFTADTNPTTPCADGCVPATIGACDYLGARARYAFRAAFTPLPNYGCSTTNPSNLTITTTTIPMTQFGAGNSVTGTVDCTPRFYYLPLTQAMRASSGYSVVVTNNNNAITVSYACDSVPCTGAGSFTTPTASSASVTFPTDFTSRNPFSATCQGCDEIVVRVSYAGTNCGAVGVNCSGASASFTIQIVFNPSTQPFSTGTQLTPTWLAAGIPNFGCTTTTTRYYQIANTADGFVSVAIGNVNNSVTLRHRATLTLYKDGCQVATCITNPNPPLLGPDRSFSDGFSCYILATTTNATSQWYATVTASDNISPDSSALTYRIQGFNTYTPLTGSPIAAQIQGLNRHYYRIASAVNGVPQSVRLIVNVNSGPFLNIEWATDSNFASNVLAGVQPTGWHQTKVAFWGRNTLSIATRAQHPGASSIFVWVSPVSSMGFTATVSRLGPQEKPTNYDISALVGTANCGGLQSTGFCQGLTGGSFWQYQNAALREQEAQCLFNSQQCRCPTPTAACNVSLTRFSCLESFRQCDANGFWTPICQNECSQVVNTCTAFLSSPANCQCDLTKYNCRSDRYSKDASVCTGVQATPTPAPPPPTPQPPAPTGTPTPTPTATPTPTNAPQPSTPPVPNPVPVPVPVPATLPPITVQVNTNPIQNQQQINALVRQLEDVLQSEFGSSGSIALPSIAVFALVAILAFFF